MFTSGAVLMRGWMRKLHVKTAVVGLSRKKRTSVFVITTAEMCITIFHVTVNFVSTLIIIGEANMRGKCAIEVVTARMKRAIHHFFMDGKWWKVVKIVDEVYETREIEPECSGCMPVIVTKFYSKQFICEYSDGID
jgi:hypothetical protein